MSTTYPNFSHTNYPDEIDTFQYFSDPTDNDVALIKQYQSYFNTGNISAAAKVLEDNPSLKNKIINATNLNKIIDAIKAIETLYMSDIQSYIMEVVTYKNVYSPKVTYSKYDVVDYNGHAYMCISSCPIGTLPTNKDYFIPLSLKGDKGESGTGLSPRGVWNEYIQYYKDDLVSYNNVLWAANEDNIGFLPSDTSTKWYHVLSMNINYINLKIQNDEIDKIFDGSAILSDDDTGVSGDSNESITKDEIDNVLST